MMNLLPSSGVVLGTEFKGADEVIPIKLSARQDNYTSRLAGIPLAKRGRCHFLVLCVATKRTGAD